MTSITNTNKETGKWGEDKAVEYLIEKGYKILERNWKSGKIEIDIISGKDGFIIFTEVKTRSSDEYGFPEEAVNYQKEENILMAAEDYIEMKDLDNEIRFDIISIIRHQNKEEIRHFIDAISPYDL